MVVGAVKRIDDLTLNHDIPTYRQASRRYSWISTSSTSSSPLQTNTKSIFIPFVDIFWRCMFFGRAKARCTCIALRSFMSEAHGCHFGLLCELRHNENMTYTYLHGGFAWTGVLRLDCTVDSLTINIITSE